MDRQIGASSAVMTALHWSVVVKKKQSQKAKLSTYRSIRVVTERMRSQIQAAEMSFLLRVCELDLFQAPTSRRSLE